MISKFNYMQRIVNISFAAILITSLLSCGNGKETKGDLKDKMAQLEKLKKSQDRLGDSIKQLEQELAVLDPSTAAKPKLVAITSLATQNFAHYIDIQGKITTNNIFYISPRGAGGQVKDIYVKQG